MCKLAVIYYSATGNGTKMAHRVVAAAEEAGAEVPLRRIAENRDLATVAANTAWAANSVTTQQIQEAVCNDIVRSDAVIFGTPTRFGSPASQFRNFIDTLGGGH